MRKFNCELAQAARFMHLEELTGKAEQLDSAYQAAFYLLSCDADIYKATCKRVSREGIDFLELKRAIFGYNERSRFLVDIAHNLFSYTSPCGATPFEISRLGYPLMEQVCHALYIAADQARVIIRLDENQNIIMELDTEPYQRTKHACRLMEQLGEEAIENE